MIEERRRHQRAPVIHEMDKPIQLAYEGRLVPGVIVDLSGGGLSMLTYATVPVGTEINLAIDLPSLKTQYLTGKVVWSLPKGGMCRVGIIFTKIDPVDFRHISRMALDYHDCETKLALGVEDVCFDKCSYIVLCQKSAKKHKKA